MDYQEFIENFDVDTEVVYSAKVNGVPIVNDNGEIFYTDDKELLREYVIDAKRDQAEEAWNDYATNVPEVNDVR